MFKSVSNLTPFAVGHVLIRGQNPANSSFIRTQTGTETTSAGSAEGQETQFETLFDEWTDVREWMDSDMTNWVGVRLRLLGSLLTLPEFGWSFQSLCPLMVTNTRTLSSGTVSYEHISIERLARGSKIVCDFCDRNRFGSGT